MTGQQSDLETAMTRELTPLERMYPNRCYDCLAVCSPDEVLCDACKAVYARENKPAVPVVWEL